jgi:response regulator NasT
MDETNNKDDATQANLETYSVIVAEDDRVMAALLATNLRRLGHRVLGIAWNGKEAVDMALKERPDVVIIDIHMPVLDGLRAAREILKSQSLAIVLSTGLMDAKWIRKAVDLKVISYLVKPYSPAQLTVAIQLAVAQSRGRSNPDTLAAAQ